MKFVVGQDPSKPFDFSQGSPSDLSLFCKSLYVRSRLNPIPTIAFIASSSEQFFNSFPINNANSVSKWHAPKELSILSCPSSSTKLVDGFKKRTGLSGKQFPNSEICSLKFLPTQIILPRGRGAHLSFILCL